MTIATQSPLITIGTVVECSGDEFDFDFPPKLPPKKKRVLGVVTSLAFGKLWVKVHYPPSGEGFFIPGSPENLRFVLQLKGREKPQVESILEYLEEEAAAL